MRALFYVNVLIALSFLPLLAFAHPGGVDENGCHRDTKAGDRHCHAHRAKNARRPHYDASNLPQAGDEGVFFGPFVRVIDGDTFEARVQGVVMKFRLESVEAPEHDQPYGDKSTAVLRTLVDGKELMLVPSDTDSYGRTVVRVWVGKLDVNQEMVRRGAAWFDSQYSKDDRLYIEENKARGARLGLWALPIAERIEPWVWRRAKK